MTSNNSKHYTLILRDTERALPLKNLLVKNNINVLIEPIYEITTIEFKPINFKEYQALLLTSVNTVKILVGNKCDMKKSVTDLVAKSFAKNNDMQFIQTSAKDSKNID